MSCQSRSTSTERSRRSQRTPRSGLCCIASTRSIGKTGSVLNRLHGKSVKGDKPYQGANLYVFRYQFIDGKWVVKESKPCSHCVKLIKKSGIKKVFYSVNDGNGCEGEGEGGNRDGNGNKTADSKKNCGKKKKNEKNEKNINMGVVSVTAEKLENDYVSSGSRSTFCL